MPTQKTRNLYPPVVVTSTLQAIIVCHFFIIEHILSRVKLIPWKLVRQCLPLLHHRAHLVTGQAHSVEVGEAMFALDILADQLEFPEGGLVLVEISLFAFKDTSLKTIGSNLGSYGPGNQSLSDLAAVEHAWGFDIIPVLLGEGVDNLLFASFLAFSKPLILSYCHDFSSLF